MKSLTCLILALFITKIAMANTLPPGFVYLGEVDPSILQEMRYAGDHNFIGRPIVGYHKATCILTKPAAYALKRAQAELKSYGYALKVYDCYRPQMAVNDFIKWSKQSQQQQMKQEFYPRINKKNVFKLDYIADKSGHTRGSTVDLTIVKLGHLEQPPYKPKQRLVPCYKPYGKRFADNSIDMGTGFDCMDKMSHLGNKKISEQAKKNRQLLQQVMSRNGFKPYPQEWWHFTFIEEPYPSTYFNFPVR